MWTKLLAIVAAAVTLCIGARAGGQRSIDSAEDGPPDLTDDRSAFPPGPFAGSLHPVEDLGVIDASRSRSAAVTSRASRHARRRQPVRRFHEPLDVGNNTDANGGSSTTVTPPAPPPVPSPFAK